MKKRKEKGTGLRRPVGEDMISKVPDSLISQLFLDLPTKEAVRTSVLSKRWKSVWLLITGLDLDSSQFPNYNAFVSFVDKFVDFSREHKSCLHKLKLKIHKNENDQSCVTPWIDFVATPKLKHLEVEFRPVKRKCLEVMPVSLFICETLLYLRLHRVLIGSFDSVALPHLKTMRLELNVYTKETVIESLISSCPVLEDLIIMRRPDDNVKVLRVHSQTLTTLGIEARILEVEDDEEFLFEDFDVENLEVLIDAPRLKYLTLEDASESITISNSSSLTKVNMPGDFCLEDRADDVDLRKRFMVRNFFTSILGITDMSISCTVFDYMEYVVPVSTQFYNLSCLQVELYVVSLEELPRFLESFPNLKSLILELIFYSPVKRLKLSSVPGCLLSSLEFVKITSTHCEWPSIKNRAMELARYFTENSVVLKKLVLPWKSSMLEKDALALRALRNLLALPRRSSTCQILVS